MIYKTLHRKQRINQHKPIENRGWTRMLRKGKQFLLHWWHLTYYSYQKSTEKLGMRKGWECDYDNDFDSKSDGYP